MLRTLEERDIRFVRLWFTDVLGFLKSVAVAPAELEGAFAEGIGFDGSAIEGFARVYESDMLAKPDPSTFQMLPWRSRVARHGADVLRHPDARRHPVLRRPAPRAQARAGARPPTWASPSTPTPRSSSSSSSSRPRPTGRPVPVDHGGYFDHTPARHRPRLPPRTRSRCSSRWASRWSSATTRAAPGQQEIDLRYADALTTADNIMTFRLVDQGGRARAGRRTPRSCPSRSPSTPAPACTRTCRCSRATATPSTRPARSTSCPRSAGRSSPGCCATPPRSPRSPTSGSTPTSGSAAAARRPAYVCWGHNNRSALVRVPMYKPQQGQLAPASRCARPTPRATPTSRSRCCSPPASRASRRATSCPRAPRTTSGR